MFVYWAFQRHWRWLCEDHESMMIFDIIRSTLGPIEICGVKSMKIDIYTTSKSIRRWEIVRCDTRQNGGKQEHFGTSNAHPYSCYVPTDVIYFAELRDSIRIIPFTNTVTGIV